MASKGRIIHGEDSEEEEEEEEEKSKVNEETPLVPPREERTVSTEPPPTLLPVHGQNKQEVTGNPLSCVDEAEGPFARR
jgi:hypothetical protein